MIKYIEELLNLKKNPPENTIDKVAKKIATFDLYDQNASADFFDPEWMFGLDFKNGFDIVIGNPPYVSALNFAEIYGSDVRNILNSTYESASTYDIYILFMEKELIFLSKRIANLYYAE